MNIELTGRIRKRFWTPFEQFAERIGQRFIVLRKITKPDVTHDPDVLPMYAIRFADGFRTDAWPEEVEVHRSRS